MHVVISGSGQIGTTPARHVVAGSQRPGTAVFGAPLARARAARAG